MSPKTRFWANDLHNSALGLNYEMSSSQFITVAIFLESHGVIRENKTVLLRLSALDALLKRFDFILLEGRYEKKCFLCVPSCSDG